MYIVNEFLVCMEVEIIQHYIGRFGWYIFWCTHNTHSKRNISNTEYIYMQYIDGCMTILPGFSGCA